MSGNGSISNNQHGISNIQVDGMTANGDDTTTAIGACPGCGAGQEVSVLIRPVDLMHQVVCGACGMRGPKGGDADEAVAAWKRIGRLEEAAGGSMSSSQQGISNNQVDDSCQLPNANCQ